MYLVPVMWTSLNEGVAVEGVVGLVEGAVGVVDVPTAVVASGAVEVLAMEEVALVNAAADWILSKLAQKAMRTRTLATENAMALVFISSWY